MTDADTGRGTFVFPRFAVCGAPWVTVRGPAGLAAGSGWVASQPSASLPTL